MAQAATRGTGNSNCLHHPGNDVIYLCSDCSGSLACVDCVTTVHHRHGLVKIIDVIPNKIDKLQDFIDKVQTDELSKLQKEINHIDKTLALDKKKFADQIRAIENRHEEIVEESSLFAKKLIENCKELEKQNSEILLDHRTKLEKILKEMNEELQSCKDIIQHGSHVQLYDKYVVNIEDLAKRPTRRDLNSVEFHASHTIIEDFADNFGFLSLNLSQELQQEIEPKQYVLPTASCTPDTPSNTEQESETSRSVQENSSTQVTVDCSRKLELTSLCVVSPDLAWTCHRKKTQLQKLNSTGEVIHILDIQININDLSFAPKTKRVWFCCEDHSVRELMAESSNSAKVRFFTEDLPRCICVTYGNSVVVGTKGKVAVYTSQGKVLFKSPSTGKSLIVSPHRLTECPVTGNFAILDRNCKSDNGEGRPNVIISTPQLNILDRYRGQGTPVETRLFTAIFKLSSFDPSAICFDNQGRLLVADYANQSLYMMSGTGEFIKTVLTVNEEYPLVAGIHSKNALFVVFDQKVKSEKRVRILKYYE